MKKSLAAMLAVFLAGSMVLIIEPDSAWAMMITAARLDPEKGAAVQKALESTVVRQRLIDLGLSREDAAARVGSLTDETLHGFASRPDSLQAGGDGVEALVVVVLAVMLVAGVLELTGHSLVIR